MIYDARIWTIKTKKWKKLLVIAGRELLEYGKKEKCRYPRNYTNRK